MPINITMPALSPTMEEGTLSSWLVKVGDQINPGDVIAEIETDKATMEVESVDEGEVLELLVEAGTEGVKVNSVIAVISGEEVGAPAAPTATPAPAVVAEAKTEAPAAAVSPAPAATPGVVSAKADGARVFASPLARRIAKDAGLDVSVVSGSGPKGRIIKRDVEAAIANGVTAAPQATATPAAANASASKPPSMSDEQVLKLFDDDSYELVKHDGMRKTIASRLQESKQNVPHFYVTADCEIDALLALRSQINKSAPVKDDKPAFKISVNDMVIKAMALALRDVPEANVSWTADNMVKHKHVDVGVAVSIDGGLITPIVRKAEEKTVSTISKEMKDLAGRARDKKLKPAEYQGGTTAVSNLGMFGVKNFSAIVNPPHSTILAVGAGEKRAIVKDGELAVATVMSVTLSTDHRSVDGALGAELMAAFKGHIENPMGMLA
ncbi:pyruvate dehydrogenase complex dihydrolipoamide acetyltransferase [Lentilitoribacter sp. Alg239-R112]|uniref:pyruvate dehydrogenase complex dihydrolipoamide acetyltransferase n=1 Tax=Lentilitoribacter sp. Alg239-R112 TaxID=2305987 RepID=UPI0013A6B851|nr:pyruvate dehydrogenase complex dihydrolipoamide acetyltransferase [Lentilitoribacter sp. Alg239-R112]